MQCHDEDMRREERISGGKGESIGGRAMTKDSERARRTEGMYSQRISIVSVMGRHCGCACQNRGRRLSRALLGVMKVTGHAQEVSGSSPGRMVRTRDF